MTMKSQKVKLKSKKVDFLLATKRVKRSICNWKLQDRGRFISPGDDVYEGMIIGLNNKDNELNVNL